MKKIILLTIGMFAFALLNVQAQYTKFVTTTNDWTSWGGGWEGYTFTPVTTFDYDIVTINGLCNNTDPGAAGTGGSLQISQEVGGWGMVAEGPLPWPALVALDGPGAIRPYSAESGYGPGSLAAQSGTLVVDYTIPQTSSYFQMGIHLQVDGQEHYWFASSATDLGPVTTPSGTMEMYRAFIPYSIDANVGGLNWTGGLGIMQNSGAAGTTPWYMDSISVVPLITPPTVTSLFATTDDFSNWSAQGGDLVLADTAWSVDSHPTNGLGNTSAAGATGTSGSLLINWSSLETGYGVIASAPDEQYNASFLQAIDPGCDPGSQTSVPAYGKIYMDYSIPDNTDGGNYFQLGISLSYNANGYQGWNPMWPGSVQDLNMQDDLGREVYRATIPYTINAGHFYGFGFNVFVNSNYQPVNGFHVDNISVSAASAPVITSVSLNAASLALQGTNGLGGTKFAVLTTTNLTLPMSQWTSLSTNVFYGSSFNVTNIVDPASPASFYRIKVPQE